HETMDSLEAMDWIDRTFLSVSGATWLPQWSFDFWFIPYILGKGVTLPQFKEFVTGANRLMALNVAYVPERQKQLIQQEALEQMARAMAQQQPVYSLRANKEVLLGS
ncbi:MAG: hypothetical protein L0331_28155, partial [Chloroflexi bacterium]|nr:hypothetical protein [Chloroflexota bacterium]